MSITSLRHAPSRRVAHIRYERQRGKARMIGVDEESIEVTATIRDQDDLETLRAMFNQASTSIYFDCRQRPMWTGYYIIGPGASIDDQTHSSVRAVASFTLIEAENAEQAGGIGSYQVGQVAVGDTGSDTP